MNRKEGKSEWFKMRMHPDTFAMIAAGQAYYRRQNKVDLNDSEFVRMCITRYVEDCISPAYPQTEDHLAQVAETPHLPQGKERYKSPKVSLGVALPDRAATDYRRAVG
jgi:hypothetical protein